MSQEEQILLRLEEKIDALTSKVEFLEKQVEGEALNLFSIFTDSADECIRELKAEGVDIAELVNNIRPLLIVFAKHVQDGSLHTLLSSGVFDKKSVETVGALGQALATTKESGKSLGPIGALFALNDRDVQKTLGFALRLSKHFGRYLDQRPMIDNKNNN